MQVFHDINRKNISNLANRCFTINEFACNGEIYGSLDKNESSQHWEKVLSGLNEKLQKLVTQEYGQGWEVVYTGLRPCIVKDGKYLEI